MPLWLRILLFFVAVTALVGLTSVYVHRRLTATLGLGRPGRVALGVVLALAPLSVALGRGLESELPADVAFGLGAGGATLILGVWISTVLLWAVDGPAWLMGRLSGRFETATGTETETETETGTGTESGTGTGTEAALTAPQMASFAMLGRRGMLRRTATGAALTVGFGSALHGAVFGRHDYDLREVPIPIPGLSPRLDGYRIAQLSDIHFGVYVGEAELRSALALVRKARPDVVVLTGDLVDHDPAHAPLLGRLIRGIEGLGVRDGVVVIPGNHDYYAGVDVILRTSADAGARVLRNAGRLLGDAGAAVGLLGVDDVWAERNGYATRPDLDRALAMIPSDVPRVLLCHNPVFFPEARGRVALQLSGHTHGGQVNLGLRPAELVLPYVEGLYEEEGSRLYVNRGFGTAGPPARVNTPPEITLVVLTAA